MDFDRSAQLGQGSIPRLLLRFSMPAIVGMMAQAVGKPKEALILMLSRQVFILIPAILVLPGFFGLDGVWASIPTADLAASILTGLCLLLELRQFGRHDSR